MYGQRHPSVEWFRGTFTPTLVSWPIRLHSALATRRAVWRPVLRGSTMFNVLHNWIFIGGNAYDEYTFVPWLNRNVYRRTVDLHSICLQ